MAPARPAAAAAGAGRRAEPVAGEVVTSRDITAALGELEVARDQHRERGVIVAYSDGFDSRAVMDLCVRVWGPANVRAFFMYFVPGLRCVEPGIAAAARRWRLAEPILQMPHWAFTREVRAGTYRLTTQEELDKLPELSLADCYRYARAKLGDLPIAHGGKASDGLWRRRSFGKKSTSWEGNRILYPIKSWRRAHVKAYLKLRGIPFPDQGNDRAFGVGLDWRSLLFLHDSYPDDFEKIARWFPMVHTVPARRKLYPGEYERAADEGR